MAKTPGKSDTNLPTDASVGVTAIVAVKNEAANIGRCLQALRPAREVFVVDSASEDNTDLEARKAGAKVIQFIWQRDYPKKRQWAIETLPITTEWILLVDADEVVTTPLWIEIQGAIRSGMHDAFLIKKQFHFLGRQMRYGGFSHSAVALFRKGCARFEHLLDKDPSGLDMEVHERLIVRGRLGHLSQSLVHRDFKGLEAYIERHNRYSTWEAELRLRLLLDGRYGLDSIDSNIFGNIQERRRALKRISIRMPFEPMLWFIYHYFIRFGFLEGRRGLVASQIRAYYVAQVRAKLYERLLGPR